MTEPTKRFIQIYTGNGKGKTTAALGQAVRAAGSRLRTFVVMFMKEYPYGEVRALERLSEWITIEQHGQDDFVYKRELPGEQDKVAIQTGLDHAKEAMLGGEYDIVILDEICVCTYFKLIEAADLIPFLDKKPDTVELILTGRYCPPEWLERADLITEMKEIKHYYQQGVLARKGFES